MNTPIKFPCGKVASNPFMLAPLTNRQSHSDGTLSTEESHWLKMRSDGGFGLIMTCAAFVSTDGIGFVGQMGVVNGLDSKPHLEMNAHIHSKGSLSIVQLYHGGSRSDVRFNGGVLYAPSARDGVEELTLEDIDRIKKDFVNAAVRSQEWGYDGIQLHGAHGYLLCEFLSDLNQRTDEYGGDIDNRGRIVVDLIEEIRSVCGADFLISVRLSPERFSLNTDDICHFAQALLKHGQIDLLDWSLWDVDKTIDETTLLSRVLELEYFDCPVSVAGKIDSADKVQRLLKAGVSMVSIGRGAILHHDFPRACLNPDFTVRKLPVTEDVLYQEGLSTVFVDYMRRWDGFVVDLGSDA